MACTSSGREQATRAGPASEGPRKGLPLWPPSTWSPGSWGVGCLNVSAPPACAWWWQLVGGGEGVGDNCRTPHGSPRPRTPTTTNAVRPISESGLHGRAGGAVSSCHGDECRSGPAAGSFADDGVAGAAWSSLRGGEDPSTRDRRGAGAGLPARCRGPDAGDASGEGARRGRGRSQEPLYPPAIAAIQERSAARGYRMALIRDPEEAHDADAVEVLNEAIVDGLIFMSATDDSPGWPGWRHVTCRWCC